MRRSTTRGWTRSRRRHGGTTTATAACEISCSDSHSRVAGPDYTECLDWIFGLPAGEFPATRRDVAASGACCALACCVLRSAAACIPIAAPDQGGLASYSTYRRLRLHCMPQTVLEAVSP